MPIAFDFADDQSVVPRDPKLILVGSGDEAEIEAYLSTHVRWNGKCMYDSITNSAWRQIPVSYIMTAQDSTVPVHYQQSMVDGMRSEGREVKTVQIDTGHSPNLTKTEEVVDAINDAIGWKPTR
jgi:pimeloyl-ACP methyl ester carboxylesterase